MINFSKTQLRPQEWEPEYRVSYWESQVVWTHSRHSNMETVRAGRDSGVQTGLSLAETDHVTWTLASHWSSCNSGLREASEACNDCPGSCWDDARTHCVMPWSVHKLYWPWIFGLYVYVYVYVYVYILSQINPLYRLTADWYWYPLTCSNKVKKFGSDFLWCSRRCWRRLILKTYFGLGKIWVFEPINKLSILFPKN